jgi:lipopolysaccharide export system permease protein
MFIRRLDRYVFAEFWKLFGLTMLGFPILLVISDLASRLEEYLNRKIPWRDLALSYVYWLPDSAFMVVPAAVLFATVFTIGSLTRHAELTAAKASGISFLRMIAPVFVGALLATGLDIGLGMAAPRGNQRRAELILDDRVSDGTSRHNFVFAGEYGRVYKAFDLSADSGRIQALQIERKGLGRNYPTYVMAATAAAYNARTGGWRIGSGQMHIVSDTGEMTTINFAEARDNHFRERPLEMLTRQRDPHELSFDELTRIIVATERSGGDANLLRVERMLKYAIPATCIIIAMFGAPLATSSQRGGSAYGVALSLATTMVFLLMIQLTRAIGAKGVVPPDFAAWIPAALFGLVGVVLLARVQS